MKCSIPEISWHNREPVLSLDIQPNNKDFYRLATGGSDTIVLIWKLATPSNENVNIQVLSELTRHQRAVNVVKFSPNGEFLASGDDDSNIIIWNLKTDNIPSLDEAESQYEERWNIFKILRGHKEDVYDIAWSPGSNKIISGSVDNTAMVWDVNSGKSQHILVDHKGFVQGVAWDPCNQFLATISSDRVCRVFDGSGKIKARIGKGPLPVEEGHCLHQKEVKYFYDDTFKSYFRRLTFSPDGSLLIVPSGSVETEDSKNVLSGTFIFTLDTMKHPVAMLPTLNQSSIAAKCCPLLFELMENGPKPVIDLPYRMVIAVATDSDLLLYDTQQCKPCAYLKSVHYTRITDLAWSSDGLLLAASSTDGFITLVTFQMEELGVPYVEECVAEKSVLEDVSNDGSTVEKVPTLGEVAALDVVPALEVVSAREVHTLNEVPTSREVSTLKEVSASGKVPILEKAPLLEEIPSLEEDTMKLALKKDDSPKQRRLEQVSVEENGDTPRKRRIQPIKIGEVTKKAKIANVDDEIPVVINLQQELSTKTTNNEDECKNQESKNETTNASSGLNPESTITANVRKDSAQKNALDLLKAVAKNDKPSSLSEESGKTNRTGEVKEIKINLTPKNKNKATPKPNKGKSADKSSGNKHKKTPTGNMSMLNFVIKSPKNQQVEQKKLKPSNLFHVEVKEDETKKVLAEKTVEGLLKDNLDVVKDKLGDVKDNQSKAGRRIPLITLASPKNKKKC